MKKYKLKGEVKEKIESILIITMFYLFLIGSALLIGARNEQIDNQIKSADSYQLTAQNK